MSAANVQALSDRITNAIEASRSTGVTNAEAIGVIEIIKLDIYQEIINRETDNDVQPK
jgi:hypothetical protein